MEDFEEFQKRFDAMLRSMDDDDDRDDKDEESHSLELQITARKKENKPATLEQVFEELIREYKSRLSDREDTFPFLMERHADELHCLDEDSLRETTCKVQVAVRDYLHVTDEKGERFLLLPDRDGFRFAVGGEYRVFTEEFKGYSFLLSSCTAAQYEEIGPALGSEELRERYLMVRQALADPEGFALWGKLGTVKREDPLRSHASKRLAEERAEELMKRIPLDRDDLYNCLSDTLQNLKCSPNNERADRTKSLNVKMQLISMMLTGAKPAQPITAALLSEKLAGARVTVCRKEEGPNEGRLPNILFVGRSYERALGQLTDPAHSFMTISLGGVDGNDYLFGDPMCYVGTRVGELSTQFVRRKSFPSAVVFSDVDLMGSTVRCGDPMKGLLRLLRTHSYTDMFLSDLKMDISNVQLICQTDSLEACPELLRREMDIIVEL